MIIVVFTILVGCNENKGFKDNSSDYLPSSWSSSEVIPLCDQDSLKIFTGYSMREKERKVYFNKKVKKSRHEIEVSFDFVTDCCLDFDISHSIENDILYIEYERNRELPCDCKCDYRGIVNIGDNQVDFTSIYRVSIEGDT